MEGNEEIQQIITEIMTFYVEDAWIFCENEEFLREFLEKCWQALSKQDEISYATTGILEILLRYHENREKFKEKRDFQRYFPNLLRFFHHNLREVRRNTYKLVKSLIKSGFPREDREFIKKIAILSAQNLLIEDQKVIFFEFL